MSERYKRWAVDIRLVRLGTWQEVMRYWTRWGARRAEARYAAMAFDQAETRVRRVS